MLVLGGFAVGGGLWLRTHASAPYRIILTTREDADDGLDPTQRRALRDWVQWRLEASGCSVLLPGPAPMKMDLPPGTEFLELVPRRSGNDLALGWRRAKGKDLALRGDGAWVAFPPSPGPPAKAITTLTDQLPFPPGQAASHRLLPQRPENFWRLLDAVAGNRDSSRLNDGCALALAVTQEEPECAMAWMVLGDLQYRRMLLAPQADTLAQSAAESHFLKALELAPETPQIILLLAQLKVDSGNHSGAFLLLSKGLKTRPNSIILRATLVYAARTAGLMQLTRSALDRVGELVPPGLQATTAENAWLYLGDRARFESTLQFSPNEPRATIASFYRGYLALSDGNRELAATWFHRSRAGVKSYSQFADLAEVYELIATSNLPDASLRLRRLSDSRVGLRVPDGEFTFKLAEAHALLGEVSLAQDTAEKAFAQGFGCTVWFDQSPFLGPLRNSPRWRALHAHLLDRQRWLEQAFPPSAFT